MPGAALFAPVPPAPLQLCRLRTKFQRACLYCLCQHRKCMDEVARACRIKDKLAVQRARRELGGAEATAVQAPWPLAPAPDALQATPSVG